MITITYGWLTVIMVVAILLVCFLCWLSFIMGAEDEHGKNERRRSP